MEPNLAVLPAYVAEEAPLVRPRLKFRYAREQLWLLTLGHGTVLVLSLVVWRLRNDMLAVSTADGTVAVKVTVSLLLALAFPLVSATWVRLAMVPYLIARLRDSWPLPAPVRPHVRGVSPMSLWLAGIFWGPVAVMAPVPAAGLAALALVVDLLCLAVVTAKERRYDGRLLVEPRRFNTTFGAWLMVRRSEVPLAELRQVPPGVDSELHRHEMSAWCHRAGRYEDSLKLSTELHAATRTSTAAWNAPCSLTRLGRYAEARHWLDDAARRGADVERVAPLDGDLARAWKSGRLAVPG